MAIQSWTTQSNTPLPKQQQKGISKWTAPTPEEAAKKQHEADKAKANAQWTQIEAKLNQKGLGATIKNALGIFTPSNIKSAIQNTSKGSPIQTAAAVGSGLLDIGPRVVNSLGGTKALVDAVSNINPAIGLLTAPYINKLPTKQLPLPGRTAMEYSGNTSDFSNALAEATTQTGGYMLGNRAVAPLKLGNIPKTVLGDVVGGQLTTEARGKERLKQAGFDAAFGLGTSVLGAGLNKVRKTIQPKHVVTAETPKIERTAPISPEVVSTTVPAQKGLPKAKITEPTKPLNEALTEGTVTYPKQTKSGKPLKPVTYKPIETSVAETPRIKTSKLAKEVEEKAVAKKLADGFEGLPEYAQINVQSQAKAATALLKSDRNRAIRIARGRELSPEGLLPESVFTAVEDYAFKTKNIDLINDLATSNLTSEATGMGQRLRMLAERNPSSPVKAIRDLKAAREASLIRRGVDVKKATKEITTEIKNEMKKAVPKPKDWASFIDSIKC